MIKLPIYLIEAKTRLVLSEIFMRFQEYYESPVFKGRYFSVEEFKSWYGRDGSSYEQDWSGFNIPSSVFEPFRNGNFDPLTERERNLIDSFSHVRGNFYIIGITKQDPEWLKTLRHELVHGAFFGDEGYKKDVLACLSHFKPGPIHTALHSLGYDKNVIDDETNAYLLTEPESLANNISFSCKEKIQDELDFVFNKHFGYSVATAGLPLLLANINEVVI